MSPKTEIVCATDLENQSLAAEKVAFKLATQLGAALRFMHVDVTLPQFYSYYTTGGAVIPPGLAESFKEKFEQQKLKKIERVIHSIGAEKAENVSLEVTSGHAVAEVSNYLQRAATPTEILVLGKRKRSFVSEFFLGSVANRLLEQVKCPVLLVPDKDEIFLSWEPKKILVATSISPGSRSAAKYADKLATLFGSEITLLHVVPKASLKDTFPNPKFLSELEVQELNALFDSQEQLAKTILEREKNQLEFQCKKVSSCVRVGNVTETVLEVAKEIQADLIVIGAYSEDGRVKLGSVAASLGRVAQLPLLVMRH